MSDTRERWYALHRARRLFVRQQEQTLRELAIYGSSLQVIDGTGPGAEYVARAMDMLVNPPMIVDPLLKIDGWSRPPRRLP